MHLVHLKKKVTMKMTLKNVGLVLGLTLISFSGVAQKSKVTSAAVEYNKVANALLMPMLPAEKITEVKQVLTTAKGFIDQAEVWYRDNKDAKDYDKMFLFRGRIYSGLMQIETMDAVVNGADVDEATIESYMDISLSSLSDGYKVTSKKKRDFVETAQRIAGKAGQIAEMAYQMDSLEMAGEAYRMVHSYLNTVEMLDSGSVYNSGICFKNVKKYEDAASMFEILADAGYRGSTGDVLAASCYAGAKNFEKAHTTLDAAEKKYPGDIDILKQRVDVYLQEEKDVEAKQALDDAITADPNNPILYYSIGSIQMKLENYDEAETALMKSLELDPKNVNTQYQLGALLYNWSGVLVVESKNLPLGDPNVSKLEQKSDEKMKAAIKYLEMYLESEPKDKYVLDNLYKAHYKQGNEEKSKEYKARLDAL